MGARDSGWIQIYSENNQEAYDNMVMAPVIAEHIDVRLPLMVCLDGFTISHSIETMQVEDDDAVREFIGEKESINSLLDTDNPVSWGALDLHNYYIEHKRGQIAAMDSAKAVINHVSKKFGEQFGRNYELFESYRLEHAERVIVAINSVAGEIKETVDTLREKGEKVGLLKIRSFRPFPYEEIRAALAELDKPPLTYNRTYGLGGRELFPSEIADVFAESEEYLQSGKVEKVFDVLSVRGG